MIDLWPFNTSTAARADALVRAYVKLDRFSGAVLVARAGTPLLAKGYGMASYEHRAPNTPRARFPIGSQTKAFTAIAILQLQEQGQLGVADRIAAYLPGYPNGDRITIHHLLTNTSGIPDYIATDTFSREMALPHTLDQLIARFKDRPPLFEPGRQFAYSNSGWVLLGAIVERVSGMSYGDYIARNIAAPAGMERSGLAPRGQVLEGRADGYTFLDGRLVRAPHIDNSTQFAGGDLHATAEDLYRWHRALDDGRLLSRESRGLLLTPHVQTEQGAYGYGVLLRQAHGRRVVETSGGTIGFVSVSTRYLEDDVTIVVLSNLESAPFEAIERDLAAIALGQPYDLPSRRAFVTVDPTIFEAYVGRYTMSFIGRTHIMEVARDGDRLMVEVQGLPRTELRPLSPARCFAQMKGEVEIVFPTGGEPARELAVTWAGHDIVARRVD
jgi:CubicO group peptidase (beta-lactamase class C family)